MSEDEKPEQERRKRIERGEQAFTSGTAADQGQGQDAEDAEESGLHAAADTTAPLQESREGAASARQEATGAALRSGRDAGTGVGQVEAAQEETGSQPFADTEFGHIPPVRARRPGRDEADAFLRFRRRLHGEDADRKDES